MTQASFDFLVIGGGSGGIAAARRAAQYGAKVALVEDNLLGGTCVNVGCVPKKLMWHAAGFAEAFHASAGFGFQLDGWSLDWQKLVSRREAYLRRLNDIYAANLDTDGITLYRGQARFEGRHTVAVDGQQLTAPNILIATGSKPIWPDMPGAALGMDSDGFFAMQQQPKRVAVVGSGYIAVELGGMLHTLGSEVHMLLRRDHLLRDFDPMLGSHLMELMDADGVHIHKETRVERVDEADGSLKVALKDGGELEADALIWAIGREPNTHALNVEAAGLEPDTSGAIVTDRYENTAAEGIYAVGDVTGKTPLTPVAVAAGRRLADRLFGGLIDRHLDYENVPTVVFSHPPIGTVGLTEPQARERNGDDIRIYETRFNALQYGLQDEKRATRMKLITTGKEERIAGLHVIGEGADEMTQGFAVAVRMGATKKDFDDTVAIHPTSAEELVTMK